MKAHAVQFCFAILLAASPLIRAEAPRGPAQPATGPGGAETTHRAVTKQRYGEGGGEYWLYEPDAPKPEAAPVTIFLHGWSATNPAIYGAWIDHLVKRGAIVIYPRYQADLRTSINDFTPNALSAIKAAFERLKSEPGHVKPKLDQCAAVGHSVGGLLAPNVAALAAESGLATIRAVMSVEPGRTSALLQRVGVELADLKKIPAETLLLAVAGDSDTIVKDVDAKRVYLESTQVPAANKDYITLISDDHGQPPLRATHFAPLAPDPAYSNGELLPSRSALGTGGEGPLRDLLKERLAERRGANGATQAAAAAPSDIFAAAAAAMAFGVDALDYYGLWKPFDGLCDAAFSGKNREYALGNTPEQRFMGKWSDGVPVKELQVGVPAGK